MTNRDLVRMWMMAEVEDYDDGCEVNCTKMAEDAAYEYDLYDDDVDFTIPEWVFELAFEVERWWLGLDDEPDLLDEDGESEDW